MSKRISDRENQKCFSPSPKLREYMVKRLQLLSQMDKLNAAGEEFSSEIYANDRSLRTLKTRILDQIIFPAMANLSYFFEVISEHSELRVLFENDIKDLLGVRHNNPTLQLSGYIFYRLLSSILITGKHSGLRIQDIMPERKKIEAEDYRLALADLAQQILYYKVDRSLPEIIDTPDARRNVLDDFDRVQGWTKMLAHRVDQTTIDEIPRRIFDFRQTSKSLIILRGPAGSGKTSICDATTQILGKEHSCELDLDITYPQEDKFENNLRNCLSSENVICMMFYGNSHTDDPSKWLDRFRDKDYKILSIILYARKETCIKRCIEDNDTGRHPINKQKELISKYYDDFYERDRNNPFAIAAGVFEVTVNTENKSPDVIAREILERFKEISIS
jgi:hypothetical protein